MVKKRRGKAQPSYTVIMINRTMKLALLDDHETEVPWDLMFDRDGEETLDPEEALSATMELPNGEHLVLDLTLWVPVTLH